MKRTTGVLLCVVATLLALGTVMVFSVLSAQATANATARQGVTLKDADVPAAVEAREAHPLTGMGSGFFLLLKHLVYVTLGVVALLALRRFDYHWFERNQKWIALATGALLLAVLVPHIGTAKNGARRWINLGPLGFQPSELAKIGMLVVLAGVVASRREKMKELVGGFLPAMAVVCIAAGLVLVEPDFGTAALLGLVGTLVVMSSGAPLAPIGGAALAGAAGFAVLVFHSPTRMERVFAFLNPWQHLDGAGYQLAQSLVTLGNGGLFGRGLGGSYQKLFNLPEASTDFILAIIGEELGLVGTVAVLFLFLLLLRQGLRIAAHARDDFGALLAYGITLLIALQALIHTAVVTASMPTKGIVLPFISSGGSSLVISLAAVGILVNIASQAREEANAPSFNQCESSAAPTETAGAPGG